MPFVDAFSSHSFRRVDLHAPTVEQLADATRAQHGEPFVLTESSTQRSVWVLPGRFAHLREQAVLDDPDPVVGSGLLDALAAGQLNVTMPASAADVAQLLEAIGGALAIVLDGGRQPVGVFVPSTLQDTLPLASMLPDLPNGRQVIALARDGNIIGALRLAEASFSTFHSEGINAAHPRTLVCSYGGGHVVGRCPCLDHTGTPCGRS